MAESTLLNLLEETLKLDTSFSRDFRAALIAQDANKVEDLVDEFAAEIVTQYRTRK